ncbi:hypothetical protein PH242_04800 [Photorhabdus bodei]|uniref:lipopolysaccharide biosynthesis protein n=1 Tax=Photorhabdus bodei TaxID=2029681 RepID=UPI00232E2BB6|nr:hypothetical protein [Photorhabdus bodei]MDB6367014.1 hypothetical protein [Photorhabdus bodei]
MLLNKKILINIVSRGSNAVIVLLINLLVVKFFGTKELGILSTYQSLINIITPFLSLGFVSYITKSYPTKENTFFTKEFINTFLCYLIFSLFSSIILFFILSFIPKLEYIFPYFIFGSFFSATLLILQSFCAIKNSFYFLAYLNLSYRMIFFLLIIASGMNLSSKNIPTFELDLISISLCILPVIIIFLVRILKDNNIDFKLLSFFFTYNFWKNNITYLSLNIIHVLNAGLGILISAFILDMESAGNLAFSQKFMSIIPMFLVIINNHTARSYRIAHEAHRTLGIIDSSKKITRKIFFPLFIILTISFLCTLVLAWHLNIRTESILILSLITYVGYIVNITYSSSGNILIISGDVITERKILINSLLINISFLTLTPIIGVYAAAIGTSMSMIYSNQSTSHFLKKKYGKSIFPWTNK